MAVDGVASEEEAFGDLDVVQAIADESDDAQLGGRATSRCRPRASDTDDALRATETF